MILKCFYIYILRSQQNNHFYIGSCKDLSKRLLLHNSLLVKSTKRYAPWDIAYIESFTTLKEARARELQLKSWKKRSALEKLIEHSKI